MKYPCYKTSQKNCLSVIILEKTHFYNLVHYTLLCPIKTFATEKVLLSGLMQHTTVCVARHSCQLTKNMITFAGNVEKGTTFIESDERNLKAQGVGAWKGERELKEAEKVLHAEEVELCGPLCILACREDIHPRFCGIFTVIHIKGCISFFPGVTNFKFSQYKLQTCLDEFKALSFHSSLRQTNFLKYLPSLTYKLLSWEILPGKKRENMY